MTADPGRLQPAHEPRCECVECRVRSAILLLRTGRAAMALRVLEEVPMLLTDALGMAYARGHDRAILTMRTKPKGPRVAFPRQAEELRRHVDRLGAERVAATLALRVADLGPLLEGRVQLGSSGLQKLRRAG